MTNENGAIFTARGLVKHYGSVVAMNGADFDLYPGEVLAVVGDNGAGKSTLIKSLSGAVIPDSGAMYLEGERVRFHGPLDARRAGIETVYQDLALAPAQDIATNLFLGREQRRPGLLGGLFRTLDARKMRAEAQRVMDELGVGISSVQQRVETLSGGQRQGVAVARAAAFSTRLVIMDEPTAALGVAESAKVLELIGRIRERGLPVVLVSHNMPHVFEIADRVHVHRLGKRVAVASPREHTMNQVVGLLTGALVMSEDGEITEAQDAVTAGLAE
ncbi:MAG: ATP-binding cassette domain-containing protein [Pseudonocardiaceae bacterium]|nr:ATP-binding cassette domain-containing protein [Pseudonocardiaceae bacterium]